MSIASDIATALSCVGSLGYAFAWADALIPQPTAGSRWVAARKVVSAVAANVRHATNLVAAGSRAAALTASAGGEGVARFYQTVKPVIAPLAQHGPHYLPLDSGQLDAMLTDLLTATPSRDTARLPPIDLARYAIPMPVAAAATASVPADSGSATAGPIMSNIFTEGLAFLEDIFEPAKQASLATDVTGMVAKVAQGVNTITMIAAPVLGAVIPGAAGTTVKSLLTDAMQSAGALTALAGNSFGTLVGSLNSVVSALPISTGDKAHASMVVTGIEAVLGMLQSVLPALTVAPIATPTPAAAA